MQSRNNVIDAHRRQSSRTQDEELIETTKLDVELAKLARLPDAETKDALQSDMKEIRSILKTCPNRSSNRRLNDTCKGLEEQNFRKFPELLLEPDLFQTSSEYPLDIMRRIHTQDGSPLHTAYLLKGDFPGSVFIPQVVDAIRPESHLLNP